MKLGRRGFANAAFCGVLAVCSPAFAESSQAQEPEYYLNLPGTDLGAALFALSRQTGVVVFYPYELAQTRGVRPVVGQYTVDEALALLLEGTGYSGGLTPQGVIKISSRVTGCSEEGKAMSLQAEAKRTVSVLALLLGAVSTPSCYAQAAGGSTDSTEAMETITVTGYRASLAASATAKRTAIGFTDSVVAEDIGKFPDRNLAEAVNRIPGITLNRNDQGEGGTITIRGLGPSFSQVLINGNRAVVGGTVDRSTPMDLFPVELFNKITVSKSQDAHTLEGGIGGSVNIVNVRPFDNPEEGFHLNYSVQEQYAQSGGSFSPRGTVIASQNWGNKFGVLFAVSASRYKYRSDNYESIGVDIPGIVDQQANLGRPVCPATVCVDNTGSSKPFHWASVVPSGISAADAAAYGLGAAGSTYTYAGPAANTSDWTTPGGTSGLSVTDLSRTIVPHLPRTEYRPGYNQRISLLTSIEYQPSEDLHFVLDAMYERQSKHQQLEDMQQYNRQSCNLAGTTGPAVFGATVNNCQVPVNFTIDSTGNLLSGKFLNSQYFLDSTENTDTFTFLNINPSVSWTVNKWLKIDGSAYFDDSPMYHHQISLIMRNKVGTGISTAFTQSPYAAMPTLVTNAPFNDPTQWEWYLIRAQPVSYAASTKGTHWDATIGNEQANLRVGYAYDEQYRRQYNYGAVGNVGNCVVLGTASGGTCTLPDGSAMAAGTAGLVPNSTLSSFFIAAPADFMKLSGQNTGSLGSWMFPDLQRLMAATKIREYENSQAATATPISSGGGAFQEKAHGFYIEGSATTQILDRDFHINAGVRYIATHQMLASAPSLTGLIIKTDRDYDAVLPSLNVSYNVMDDLILRFAGNRSMTRATPASMFPGSSFPTADISPINAGNPNLTPYFSDNFDLGLEYYSGGPGVIAVNAFSKDVSGFTVAGTTQMKFGDTGIPYSILTPLMQAEFNANGGNNVLVQVNSQVNLQQKLHIRGIEVQVVQPLDFVWEGIGFTANYTRVQQHVDAGLTPSVAAAVATGIAPWQANLGAYYEGHGFSMHVTYNYTAAYANCSTPCYNGVQVPEYTDIHRQVDLAASYMLPLDGTPFEGTELTFDAVNLNNEMTFRKYVGNKNAPSAAYWAGPQYTLGLRGKF